MTPTAALRRTVAKLLRGAWRLGELACSSARKTRLRLMYPGFDADRTTFIGPGCDIRVSPGGTLRVRSCAVTRNVTLTAGPGARLSIEAHYLGPGTVVVAREEVLLGRGTKVAENVVIRDANHDHTVPLAEMRFVAAPVVIGEDVWLGARATVLAGVTIGDHSSIGAGAVVTRSVPADSRAWGVPARVQ
ncbi:DapH/DapD/GlmU-related protein [Microbacterium sp. UMB0228]|uniref:acyltransferase n=1 Tax=Microbacterium sp. UMB0228 TaxID=2029109 RepID=UPI002155A421|nr:acyltransferase [Microbacterium sp. UMB0228]